MTLNKYQRFAYRLLGDSIDTDAQANAHLRLSLQRAHIYQRPEVYLGYSYLNMVVAFAATLLLVVTLAGLDLVGMLQIPAALYVVLVPLPLALSFGIYLITFLLPDIKAQSRAQDIDAKLPYALNYMSAMASAGVTPDKIFQSMAEQPIYGEAANEAALIARDLNALGRDLVTSLSSAIDRSPSVKFQDFLQGAVTSITSGGDFNTYLRAKADQFVRENRQEQEKFLENLGVLAESYVTVVVAGPLFVIVLLAIMIMFGGQGGQMLSLGYMLVLLLVPLAQLGFAVAVKSVTPEA